MNLEKLKKELELKKVETAKLEMEYKIMERMQDIERLQENIIAQDLAIKKIKEEISTMEG